MLLRTVEEEFGLLIFDRANYRPVLTPEGRTLYQKSKPLIDQADELAKLCEHMATGAEMDFCLTVNPLTPLVSILAVIRGFEDKFPMTSLHLEVADHSEPLVNLLSDKADIAISQLGRWQDKLESVFWQRLRIIPVCTPVYLERMDALTLNQSTQVVLAGKEPAQSPLGLVAGCKHWFVDNQVSLVEIVSSGLAWGFVPECAVAEQLRSKTLVPIKQIDAIDQDLYLSRMRGRSVGEAHEFLWEQLVKNRKAVSDAL